jgi:hypothetical protein
MATDLFAMKSQPFISGSDSSLFLDVVNHAFYCSGKHLYIQAWMKSIKGLAG